jgi:hypothetical protein
MGPSLLMPNGDVFLVGATGHTALYNPQTNTWSPGPDVIGSLNGSPALFGADDAPGAVLPSNGNVFFTADAGPELGTFSPPQEVFDYNPNTNKITQVSSPDPILPVEPTFTDRMLVLPTGQILFEDGGPLLYVYTPDGHPQASWQPDIQHVTNNNDGTFTLTGKQLNGQSAGATYGDDAEMDSNYPIIYLTAGYQTFYARTYNWSNTGVQTGNAVESVNFVLPAGIPAGNYSLYVSGAGISSQAIQFQVTASMAMASSGGLSAVTIGGAPNPGMAGVSLALTHTGVVSHAAALSNSAAKADPGAAGAASFGLAGGAVLQDSAAATLAAPRLKSTDAGTDALDTLFADYFVNPL